MSGLVELDETHIWHVNGNGFRTLLRATEDELAPDDAASRGALVDAEMCQAVILRSVPATSRDVILEAMRTAASKLAMAETAVQRDAPSSAGALIQMLDEVIAARRRSSGA